jgi:hypothetical protein
MCAKSLGSLSSEGRKGTANAGMYRDFVVVVITGMFYTPFEADTEYRMQETT